MGTVPLGLRVGLGSVLVSVVLLQRFGINLGSYSLNVVLVAIYGCLAIALLSHSLRVSLPRLALYVSACAVASTSFLLNADRGQVSMGSLALLVVMYVPYACLLEAGPRTHECTRWVLERFSDLALVAAVAGILQFFLQFFFRPEWLFDFTPLIPEPLRGPSGYNTVIQVGSQYKSNGFFFREPSGCSFVMALALLLELARQRRILRMVAYSLALLLTYSGTGLLALLIGLSVPLRAKTLVRWAGAGCAAVALYLLLGETLNLDYTVARLGEFSSERSSAYIRYVAPFRLLFDTFDSSWWTPWLGHGPGAISRAFTGYAFHDPTWAKLLYEYGLLGFVVVGSIVLMALAGAKNVPISVRTTLFASWLVMGGHLLTPENNYLLLTLAGLLTRSTSVLARERTREVHELAPELARGAWPASAPFLPSRFTTLR